MKKNISLYVMLFFVTNGFGQLQEMEQLTLNLQKLAQMKSMLSSMYNGYSVLTKGYNEISSLSKGNFNLHEKYLKDMLAVSTPVKNYRKISSVIAKQSLLVTEYKAAFRQFRTVGLFAPAELADMKSAFDAIVRETAQHLDGLLLVLTPGKLRMSDEERVSAIDRIDADVDKSLADMKAMVNERRQFAAIRSKKKQDIDAMKVWYGLKQ